MQARRQIVLGLVDALEQLVAHIAKLTAEIRQALEEHPDGATFRSLFIAPDSILCAATMLSEIGDCRDRYPSYRQLAADGGQAPVAVESGKSKRAQFRWACDHRLREAFNVLADSSRRHNPWAADIYDRARARGASHQHGQPHPRPRLVPGHLATVGTTTTPTTPTNTPPASASSPRPPDNRRSSGPTSSLPSDGRCRRHRRLPAGQSAQRLTASRPTLPPPAGVDTGGLEGAASRGLGGPGDSAALERQQPRRPTRQRLPVCPGDAALRRRRRARQLDR